MDFKIVYQFNHELQLVNLKINFYQKFWIKIDYLKNILNECIDIYLFCVLIINNSNFIILIYENK